jgi:HlyD family secretion protein
MRKGFIRRYIVPVLGIVGLGWAIYYSTQLAAPKPAPPQMLSLPAPSPFQDTISGSGLLEANSRDIDIGSHVSGVVTTIYVKEGDAITVGMPLLKLDDRTATADLTQKEQDHRRAEAGVGEARAALADLRDQLARTERLKIGSSISEDRVDRLRFGVKTAEARVRSAEAAVAMTGATIDAAKTALEKLTITSPIEGQVLKVNTQIGEFVNTLSNGRAPMVIGNITPLHVRVSIDENDIWRLKPEARATGALRGNKEISFLLQFVRVEPLVIPKRALTGDTGERVDTRIMEVIYAVKEVPDRPLYVGQQIDVFIETGP